MTNTEIIKTVEEYKAYEEMINELKIKMDILKGELVEELETRETEEMTAGQYVIRNVAVSSSRFDTKLFKSKLGEELYKSFMREVLSHRFTIAA